MIFVGSQHTNVFVLMISVKENCLTCFDSYVCTMYICMLMRYLIPK